MSQSQQQTPQAAFANRFVGHGVDHNESPQIPHANLFAAAGGPGGFGGGFGGPQRGFGGGPAAFAAQGPGGFGGAGFGGPQRGFGGGPAAFAAQGPGGFGGAGFGGPQRGFGGGPAAFAAGGPGGLGGAGFGGPQRSFSGGFGGAGFGGPQRSFSGAGFGGLGGGPGSPQRGFAGFAAPGGGFGGAGFGGPQRSFGGGAGGFGGPGGGFNLHAGLSRGRSGPQHPSQFLKTPGAGGPGLGGFNFQFPGGGAGLGDDSQPDPYSLRSGLSAAFPGVPGGGFGAVPGASEESFFWPPLDLFDKDAEYELHVALPGAAKEDVRVDWNAETHILTISGSVSRPGGEELQKQLSSSERSVGDFERRVALPPVFARGKKAKWDVDGDKISARLDNGILYILAPKIEKQDDNKNSVEVK